MKTKLRFTLVLTVLLFACVSFALVLLRTQIIGDPLSGTWAGDWGPTPSHRNSLTIDLKWDGTTVRGVMNPGPHALPLTKASFDARKRLVHWEVGDISEGREVHFNMEEIVEGGTLIG